MPEENYREWLILYTDYLANRSILKELGMWTPLTSMNVLKTTEERWNVENGHSGSTLLDPIDAKNILA